MATTPKSPRTLKSRRSKEAESRAAAVSREVMQRLGRDQILVDRLVDEMEASMASTSGRPHPRDEMRAIENAIDAGHRMSGQDTSGGGVDGKAAGRASGKEVACDRAMMKALLEKLLQQRGKANTTSGSNLLGELKQCIDLESLVVRRCWEMMEEDWFDNILRNTA